MTSERRQSFRHPAHLEAIVVCNDGLTRLPAIIVNQSDTGLRVRLVEDNPLDATCYILFQHRMEPCRLVWQASRSAGLAFAQ